MAAQKTKPLATIVADAKRAAIRAALVAESGAITRAALRLSMPAITLRQLIKRLGLTDEVRAAYPLSGRQPKR